MKHTAAALATMALAVAGPARAQTGDIAQSFAAGIEEAGQSLGLAAFAGPNLFVTAKGRTRLPAPIADAYFVTVEGKSASAVTAAQSRDARVAQLTAAGRRAGVEVEQGQTSISFEVDTDAQQRANAERIARLQARTQAGTAQTPLPTIETPPKIFIARTSLRFRPRRGGDVAAFLDAAHAAGVDDISHGLNSAANPFLPRGVETFGFGSVDSLDDDVWSAAAADALGHARTQAQALASAAGRTLGPARAIIVLSRGVEGGEAVESLAVRFVLADPVR